MLKLVESQPRQYSWADAFLRKLNQAGENMNLLKDRWFCGSFVYAGVRSVLELGHDIKGLTMQEAQETTEGRQAVLDLIFSAMSSLTPRQFEQVFPVIKEYDGHKWQSKDYFYTRNYLRTLNLDEPIGEEIHSFLWEYHNFLTREFTVYSLGIIDDFLRLQGKPTTCEQWAQENNIPIFYEHKDPVTGQSYLQDSISGRTTPIKKAPVLMAVK